MYVPHDKTPPRLLGFDYRQTRSYFVTFCVMHRERIFRVSDAARAAADVILDYRRREWYHLYAYCVMPTHIHVLLGLPRVASRSLTLVVAQLKRGILHANRLRGIFFRWQFGYYDHIVRDYEKSNDFVKYILLNPVRAGLVRDFAEYEYAGRCDPWY
jgi:REP element-mobilizing transposase RayT